MDKTDNNKKGVLETLREAHGIITTACHNAGVARSQFYVWIGEDLEFKAAVDDIQEEAIDFVESKLFEKVNGVQMEGSEGTVYTQPPSDTAIIFYLKTKAKKRGYVERQEITGADGNPIQPVINMYLAQPAKIESTTGDKT